MRRFKLQSIVLCILLQLLCNEKSYGRFIFDREHLLDSARTVVSGVSRQVANNFPRPREFFDISKQTLIGLPERAVFGTIHQICSLYLASDKINPRILPEMEQMFFQLRTPCQSESFPIEEADKILESPLFDPNKKVVLFVSGWKSTVEAKSIANISKAYNCRGGYNFLALNASYFIDTLYTWSAFNTEELGRIVAIGLQKLHNEIPAENIHLIGFSLGAHIVGSAGRYFQQFTGKTIPRITGLDPANPCFNEGESLSGLQRGDADFIDVIHTNPGGLGKRQPLGDVDFYAGGFSNVKPGCNYFSCSHQRAWKYYAESVYPGHENGFMATRCNSLKKVQDGICTSVEVPMGFNVPLNVKGTYVVSVNKKAPYGQSTDEEEDIVTSECGLCESD